MKTYLFGEFKRFDAEHAPKNGRRLLCAWEGFESFIVIRWVDDYGWVLYYNEDEKKVMGLDSSSIPDYYIDLGASVATTDKEITYTVS